MFAFVLLAASAPSLTVENKCPARFTVESRLPAVKGCPAACPCGCADGGPCDCDRIQFRAGPCPGGKCPLTAPADPLTVPSVVPFTPAVPSYAPAPAYQSAPAATYAPAAGGSSATAARGGPVRRILGCLFRRCR
jgi:hypothetical protein